MAKSAKQKLKLLYILKILKEESDELHPVSMKTLIEKLESYDIIAERKSIYDDMSQLNDFGYDIICIKSKVNGGYYLAQREFELPELKLLVDAIQASKYITLKQSRELIKKLEQFVSTYDAQKLNREVYVSNRIKTENERVFYNVDGIHSAIQNNHDIAFEYMEWNMEKQLVPKKNGERYHVSPWALTCKDDNYYLVAYESKSNLIKHYRVDKMAKIEEDIKSARSGAEMFRSFDLATYTNQNFGMFGGDTTTVTLVGKAPMIGVIMDRFGRDVSVRKVDEDTFKTRVSVAISNQFFGWISGLDGKILIESPEDVKKRYKEYIANILEQMNKI